MPITIFLKKYSYSPCFGWCIYILSFQFAYEMLIMRQSIATGINLIALGIILEKKTKKRLILSLTMCLFSATIHLGGLFLLLY